MKRKPAASHRAPKGVFSARGRSTRSPSPGSSSSRPTSPRPNAQSERRWPRTHRQTWIRLLPVLGFLAGIVVAFWQSQAGIFWNPPAQSLAQTQTEHLSEIALVPDTATLSQPLLSSGQEWPLLDPLPPPQEVVECQVVIVGGSLGGVAAAAQAMQAGSTTCLIELTPWLGGQISSQGVSAIDESLPMREQGNFSDTWIRFKQLIEGQTLALPHWTGRSRAEVRDINSCWVGGLCFMPQAGASAAETWLRLHKPNAPASRWLTSTAFKGAEFDASGHRITAVFGVRRIPRDPHYHPLGRLSQEFHAWYSWAEDETFMKVPIRLQAPPGEQMMVIDATDTDEVVAWAGIPYRVGSESRQQTGEPHAGPTNNPECTQAFTFPFLLGIHDDQGRSLKAVAALPTGLSRAEHRRQFGLEGFPLLTGKSFFNYRRVVSLSRNDPFSGTPGLGDITLVNWNQGNDWGLMNPALLMTPSQIRASGQQANWQGGMNFNALKDAENHALLFAEWLMQTHPTPGFPLALLQDPDLGMGTVSGLSLYPYIREGRRILGRAAYGQQELMLREQDIRLGTTGGRDFSPSAVALTHYAIDMHGCRYRNWQPSGSSSSAPINEFGVRPIRIPVESLIPQKVDNLLIGGKGIAVSHIVNAATRTHYGEWGIGSAAGITASWILHHKASDPNPYPLSDSEIKALQTAVTAQGIRLHW